MCSEKSAQPTYGISVNMAKGLVKMINDLNKHRTLFPSEILLKVELERFIKTN